MPLMVLIYRSAVVKPFRIVGESGCGKSTLAQLLMGMLQPSHGQYIRSGSQRIMQMVFQDPLSSLNPRFTGVAHHHRNRSG